MRAIGFFKVRTIWIFTVTTILLMGGPVFRAAAAEKGTVITFEVASKGKSSIDREIARRSVEVMKNRLDSVGVTEGTVEQRGDRGIVVRVTRPSSEVDWIVNMLSKSSRLEFRLVNDEGSANEPADDEEVLSEARMGGDGKIEELPYLVKKRALLSGDIVESAAVLVTEYGPAIDLALNSKGTATFAKVTEASIGKRIAVVVDDNVISAPVVRDSITGGRLQITGSFTVEEAGDLVNSIKTSFLPAAIKVADRHELPSAEEPAATAEANVDDVPDLKAPLKPDNYAIVIGIEKYRDIQGVDFATHDAATMQRYLTGLMGYPAEHVVYLPNERATKSDLQKYLGVWLKNRVTPQSTVFVYYAGHGAPNPTSGEPYLVPYDGDPNYLETTAYPLKDLYAGLSRLPAKEIVVVLDACFSGSGERSVIAKGARPLVMTADAPAAIKENMVVLAAAGSRQISTSHQKKEHGLFTYYLLKGLRGEADAEKKGEVTVEGVYRYLSPRVEQDARLQNVEQTPVIQPGLASLKERGKVRLR